ncbi:TPA: SIS domain-containing protein [Klebsiella quasipneumoniae subsp. similipneumoniae]|nr:SIS domain-containing protein [Klebsiella quasipneumoniae subsp. similipneumoniae]
MNSADVWDSRKAIMPLSDTLAEVNLIKDYITSYNLDEAVISLRNHFSPEIVKTICIIGSGDSYALSLLYSALFINNLGIHSIAVQSYEFLNMNRSIIDESWLIIILSASGRPSPVVEALVSAQETPAQVLGITNTCENFFSLRANHAIATKATKKGMPTQSTIATALYLDAVASSLSSEYLSNFKNNLMMMRQSIPFDFDSLSSSQIDNFADTLFKARLTLLGSAEDYGLALLFSNLLYCGPQLDNQVLYIEEYTHALRVNQAKSDDLVIILSLNNSTSIKKSIVSQLRTNHADVIVIDSEYLHRAFPNTTLRINAVNCRYYVMFYIFNVIISATKMYISRGGRRVSLE